jgi:hypothetical protein
MYKLLEVLMYKFRHIDVVVDNVEQDVMKALIVIDTILKKNEWDLDIEVHYDYHSEDLGYYIYNRDKKKHCLYVNPVKCYQEADDEDCHPQYTDDNSIFSVLIHEFVHMLSYTVLPKMLDDYKHTFATKRFYINEYASKNLSDEVAEIGTLYIVNPYFLKLIAVEHWRWFKSQFKSSQPCSPQYFMLIYNDWPAAIKEKCATKWSVVIDQEKNKPVYLADPKTAC